MPMTSKLISRPEAARLLNRHPLSLLRWEKEGKLKPLPPPDRGRIFYDREAVEIIARRLRYNLRKKPGPKPKEPAKINN